MSELLIAELKEILALRLCEDSELQKVAITGTRSGVAFIRLREAVEMALTIANHSRIRERICIDFCQGIPTENMVGVKVHDKLLEATQGIFEAGQKYEVAARQRDELLIAIHAALFLLNDIASANYIYQSVCNGLREVIEKVEAAQ